MLAEIAMVEAWDWQDRMEQHRENLTAAAEGRAPSHRWPPRKPWVPTPAYLEQERRAIRQYHRDYAEMYGRLAAQDVGHGDVSWAREWAFWAAHHGRLAMEG